MGWRLGFSRRLAPPRPGGQVYRQPHRSLDGRGAAWFAEDTSSGDVWVQYLERVTVPTVDTLHEIRASMTDVQGGPRVSPDGSRLLYGAQTINPATEMLTMRLEVYDAAATQVVATIPNGEDGDWSPDGRYIAYMDYEQAASDPARVALYVYDTVDGTSRAVPTVHLAVAGETDVYRPRCSPDGAWISVAKLSYTAETTSVLVTDPAGTLSQTWLTGEAGQMGLGMGWMWAPTGPSRLFVETVVPRGAPYWLSEVVPADGGHALALGCSTPYADITRVQLALMISRAAGGKLSAPGPAAAAVFTDLQGLSAEARQAIALCYEHGIISGKTATTFVPYGHATRGQAAKMTWHLLLALGSAE